MTRVIDARPPKRAPGPSKRKRKVPRPALSLWRLLLSLTLAIAIGLAVGNWQVERIRVRGAQATQLAGVEAQLRPYLGAPFFFVDRKLMAQTLAGDPWIEEVKVRRRPPGTVVLEIKERTPRFRLADGGGMDAAGNRLPPRPGVDLSALPLLQEGEFGVRERGQLEQLTTALGTVPWGTMAGLSEVVFTREGLELLGDDGVRVVLGEEDYSRRLARLAAAREKLRPIAGDRLDLRFSRQIILSHTGGG